MDPVKLFVGQRKCLLNQADGMLEEYFAQLEDGTPGSGRGESLERENTVTAVADRAGLLTCLL